MRNPPGSVIKRGQRLPEDFVELLARWRETRDPRLPLLCYRATVGRGWTLRVVAQACGVTPEGVRQWTIKARRFDGPMPPIPDPPLVPYPMTPPSVAERLGAERVTRLRAMAAIARTVGGRMAVDHPRRRVSAEFSAELAALVEEGYTPGQIGKVLGYSMRGIAYRLARHGCGERVR